MLRLKKIICTILAFALLVGLVPTQTLAASKTVVEKRIAEVRKMYPQDSTFDEWVRVTRNWEYGGCLGIVAYMTEKVFHNAYYDGSSFYKSVGSASTTSTSKMKTLFKKAKPGDIIKWSKKGEGTHYAIFLSDNASGVNIYEANFGKKNQVWYNHLWKWSVMKDWPVKGADKVAVYRASNYAAVNSKKDAKKTPVGTVLMVDEFQELRVKVIDNSIANGTVLVLDGYLDGTDLPKGVGIKDGYISAYYNKSQCLAGDANSYEYFKVVAYNDLKPAKVKNLTLANSAKKTLKLNWKQVKGATGYEVYRATKKNGTYKLVKTIQGASKTSYSNTKLKKGTTYYYKVRAYKKIGNEKIYGSYSTVVSKKVKK